MTTPEALQQVISNTRVPNLSDIASDDAVVLIRALNAAVQDYFDLAPPVHKRTTLTHYMTAPTTVSSVTVTAGEVIVSGNPFTVAQRGATIVLEGDSTLNEIVDTNALLRPYLGTSGTVDGIIYGDAVPITDFSVEKVVSDPKVRDSTGKEGQLARVEINDGAYVWAGSQESTWTRLAREVGFPRYYRMDPVGGSIQTSNDAVVILRVAPRPSHAMVFEVDVEFRPAAYAITAINTAKNLPVPREKAGHLLPLIEAKLVGTPLWTGSQIATQIVMASEAAARQKIRNLPTDLARSHNRCGTRPGY